MNTYLVYCKALKNGVQHFLTEFRVYASSEEVAFAKCSGSGEYTFVPTHVRKL